MYSFTCIYPGFKLGTLDTVANCNNYFATASTMQFLFKATANQKLWVISIKTKYRKLNGHKKEKKNLVPHFRNASKFQENLIMK